MPTRCFSNELIPSSTQGSAFIIASCAGAMVAGGTGVAVIGVGEGSGVGSGVAVGITVGVGVG